MVKNIIVLLLVLFMIIHVSCSPAKHTATVKLNDIDSAIRTINPNHNCGCNWGDRTFKLYTGGTFSKYNYFWSTNYVKNIDSINILSDSKKIKEEIIKLDPNFNEYNRFFLEYRIFDNTNADTSIKYKVVGTWFSFKNSCSGFVKNIDGKKLVKKTALDSYKKQLCKQL